MSYNTYPQNPFPPNSENAGCGGSPYVLPIASANELGGVKVGSNLTIDENGVLSASVPSLPVYSSTPQKIGVYVDSSNIEHDLYRKIVRFTSGADVRLELLSFPTTNIWLEFGKVVNGDQIAPIPVLFVSVGTSSTFFYKDGSKTYLFMNLADSNWRNKPAEISIVYCE